MIAPPSSESGDDPVAIDIVLVPLRVSPSVIRDALGLLDGGERAAALARDGDARHRHVVAHAAARTLIGQRLGTDPARILITSRPGGRPEVDGLSFSLSHAGDRAAVAMAAPGLRLGVDLERVRGRAHLDRLAQRVFAPGEYDLWRSLEPRARPRAFAQGWIEVEAVLKARGTGIAGGLAGARELESGWSRTAFDAGAGYVGAIAVDAAPVVLSTRVFRLGDVVTRRGGTAR